jgi:hypothetical protein
VADVMISIIDRKFINLVSSSLDKFKWKKDNVATCRCYKCGDSQKSKSKTRGYFYINKDHYYFKCHNCGFSCTIKTILEDLSPQLAKEYALETYRTNFYGNTFVQKIEKPVEKIVPDYIGTCILDLPDNHYARQYVNNRKIPTSKHKYLYYSEDFSKIADKFFKTSLREPRLVIPFFDDNGKVIGVQGRSFDKNAKIRYITYKSPHVERLWYGIDRINSLKPVYVVEGPLDSLFLDNAIAMVGSSYPESMPSKIEGSELIFAFDNECRNAALHAMMEKAIENGHKIVIWPPINEKDINEMVINMGQDDLKRMLDTSIYSGNAARLKFQNWRRT